MGCGTGMMTERLCQSAGPHGQVIAIDSNAEQISATQKRLLRKNIRNISFHVLSIYDLQTLNTKFDLIYCRFLDHHLHSPLKAIQLFFDLLNPGGIYVG